MTFLVPSIDEGIELYACRFFVSIVDGQGYNKIPLTTTKEDNTLQIRWDIESRTTGAKGNHPFQLVAEDLAQEIVWLTNTSHVVVRESLQVDDPISGLLPSVLQTYQERMDHQAEDAEKALQRAQSFAEQAARYAQQTARDQENTTADRELVEHIQLELSEQFDGVLEKMEQIEALADRVEEVAQQAELAGKQAEQSQAAAQEAKQTAADLYSLLPLVTVSGNGSVELPSCAAAPLRECVIHGAHTQEGTPTPEVPISPKFVGGGNVAVSITDSDPKTVSIPLPLVDESDCLNLITGRGKTTWKEMGLADISSWLKSGKTAAGGTVFYAALPGQDTQGTTKEVISTHFHQAQNVGTLVPGDIWMYNSTFIAVSNTLLGITDSDNDSQKVEKFKSWLSSQKEAGHAVKVWYQPTEAQAIEISPVALTTRKGNVTLTVSGAEGGPIPDIQATAVQDWTMLKEEQEKKNRSYEERLNALEANVTGG